MPKLELSYYQPNINDPRVARKVREVLTFADTLRLSKKPQNIHNRKLQAIFGNTRRIGLGRYLKSKLLFQTGSYQAGKQSFTYILNEEGYRALYSMIGAKEPNDIDIAKKTYEDILTGSQEIEYMDSGTRLYHPIQNLRKNLRKEVFTGWFDYDIETAAATLVSQYARGRIEESENLILAVGEFDAIEEYIKNKEPVRNHIASIGQVSIEKAKEIANALIFQAHPAPSSKASLYNLLGGNEVTHALFLKDPFVAKFRKQIREMWRWAQLRDRTERRQKKMEGIPTVDALTGAAKHRQQIYQTLEREVMTVVIRHLRQIGARHILMHDGFMSNVKISVELLQEEVNRQTNFSVKFSERKL